jgi:acetylornithine deacetylase/succinyl-diaminopimelate desuccinylase-like protein
MEAAVQLMRTWAERHAPQDSRIEILRLPNRTPLLMIDVPGAVDDCVLMYGHLDKQPEFSGWNAGLGPWEPVLRDGKLYGRGGADDGYALFASLTAINALRAQKLPHARCVVLIEASEESGSPDLEHHIAALAERLGRPSSVVCLDAECGNYDQLWCTTSLRGNLIGTLRVDVLTEGVHSGSASGIVPSSFRVLRELLARVEDASSGAMLIEELNVAIPPERRQQAAAVAAVLGDTVAGKFPLRRGHAHRLERSVRTAAQQHVARDAQRHGGRRHTGRRCRRQCAATYSALKLSFRLPPTVSAEFATELLTRT